MKLVATLVSAVLCSTFVAGKADHKQVARHLEKRFTGHATYFAVGLGACGKYSQPSDFVVAMNTPQYGSGSPGPQCFKTIVITAGGKSATAIVMDECPTCAFGCLDMSEGLFQHFNSLSVGEFPISWSFGDGSGGGGGGNNDPKPTTTHHKQPPTTHHTSTTTHTTPTSTRKTSSTKTSTTHLDLKPTTSKTRATSTSTSTSPSYSPSTTSSPAPTVDNFKDISQFILNLQNLLQAAAGN